MRMGCEGIFNGFTFGAGFELMRHVIVPAIVVAAPLVLWWWLGPDKPSCDTARSQAGRVAIAQVAERIRLERGSIRRAAVLHFTNDPTDFLTTTLRRRLLDSGILDLDGTPPSEKVRMLLNLRNPGTFEVETAVKYGKSHGLEAVVIGAVDVFETVKDKATLNGKVKFVKVAGGEAIEIPLTDEISGQTTTDGVPLEPPSVRETLPLFTRILLMALGIFIVPVFVFPFLKLVMRRNSNLATGILLVLLLAIDGVIISIALGTSGTFCALAVFLVALAAAFGYDLFMLSYAQLCQPALPGT